MSLATRCTACGTVFRVVQDQLKVSEGWVRCGRCNEVFNALEGLFDLERDSPPDVPALALRHAAPDADGETDARFREGGVRAPADTGTARLHSDSSTDGIDKIDAQLKGPREAGHDSTPATRISERDRLEFPDAQFDPDMLADDDVDLDASATGTRATEEQSATDAPDRELPNLPGFVEHAQRRARWNTPGMLGLQAGVVVVLLAALALQGMHQFRDAVAARWPGVGPALASWCDMAGCRIGPPHRIDDLAVESTALARASVPDAFRLSVVLRNRGETVLAVPTVDLSLTDVNGQLISRRMLAPRDFRVASATIRSGAELAMHLVLSTGGARVTGYTVEVFYP